MFSTVANKRSGHPRQLVGGEQPQQPEMAEQRVSETQQASMVHGEQPHMQQQQLPLRTYLGYMKPMRNSHWSSMVVLPATDHSDKSAMFLETFLTSPDFLYPTVPAGHTWITFPAFLLFLTVVGVYLYKRDTRRDCNANRETIYTMGRRSENLSLTLHHGRSALEGVARSVKGLFVWRKPAFRWLPGHTLARPARYQLNIAQRSSYTPPTFSPEYGCGPYERVNKNDENEEDDTRSLASTAVTEHTEDQYWSTRLDADESCLYWSGTNKRSGQWTRGEGCDIYEQLEEDPVMKRMKGGWQTWGRRQQVRRTERL